MLKQFKSKQFLTFVITGGIASLINFSSRILYSNWVDFSAAIICAYVTGMITAFLLAKVFVFKDSSRALHHSAIYFFLVNLLAIAQTWFVSMSLFYYVLPYLGVLAYGEDISHGVGVLVPVFSSYLGHKYLTFK